MPPVYSVHSPVGFDERPILHCIRSIHEHGGRISRLVLYQPATGIEYGERRSREATETLKHLMLALGASVEVARVPAAPLQAAMLVMYSRIHRELGDPSLFLAACLSSGMRPLVVALYSALLAVPEKLHERIYLCVEPEGMPEHRMFIRLDSLTRLSEVIRRDERAAMVLSIIVEQGGATLTSLERELKRRGVSISRSALYRMLQKLVESGILVKEEAGGVYKTIWASEQASSQ